MDTRPVFVLTTAKTCPGCHAFKRNTWDSLKEELEKQGKVQVVTIEVEKTNDKPDPVKYHKDLSRFIGWFPTMAIFPASRWFNHKSELIGIVKNGKLVPPGTNENGQFMPEHLEIVGKMNLSKDDILNWVDYTVKQDMFNRNEPVHNNNNNKIEQKENKIINNKAPDGKFIVPTAAYYAKFRPSKVE